MKVPWVFFGSEKLTARRERKRAKRDLKRGIEPALKYRTGKFWTD